MRILAVMFVCGVVGIVAILLAFRQWTPQPVDTRWLASRTVTIESRLTGTDAYAPIAYDSRGALYRGEGMYITFTNNRIRLRSSVAATQ